MTVLVTGAAGFIGYHIARKLAERGETVLGVDNLNEYYGKDLKRRRLVQLSTFQNFRFQRVDLSERGALEAAVAAADPADPDTATARDKLRLLKGVVYWQMNEGFRARAWAARKGLREVAQGLRETEQRWALVEEAREAVPDRNGEFAARIATLRPRIDGARAQVAAMKTGQAQYLAGIAVRELEAQKSRIDTYLVQARYSLATIYDRASASTTATPAAPATENRP